MDWHHVQNITKIDNGRRNLDNILSLLCTILVKLRYANKGSTIGQHAFKRNVVNFAQDFKSAVKLLNTLPSSLKSLSDIIIVHFVGSSHPLVELVKSCKLLYIRKYVVTIWLTWLKMHHIYRIQKYNYEYGCFKHLA
jgi:hypothetical protein